MSVKHKQHCPPRIKCPGFGEKGSRRIYASSKSLQKKKCFGMYWLIDVLKKGLFLTLVASYGSCLINKQGLWNIEISIKFWNSQKLFRGFGSHAWSPGVLPEKLGRGLRPTSEKLYPIYDQNLQYFLPLLCHDQTFETLLKGLGHAI